MQLQRRMTWCFGVLNVLIQRGKKGLGVNQREGPGEEHEPFSCRRKALHRGSASQKLHLLDRGRR